MIRPVRASPNGLWGGCRALTFDPGRNDLEDLPSDVAVQDVADTYVISPVIFGQYCRGLSRMRLRAALFAGNGVCICTLTIHSWGNGGTLPSQVSERVRPVTDTLPLPPGYRSARLGGATVGDLVDAGLIRAPFRIERENKGARVTAAVRPDGKFEFCRRDLRLTQPPQAWPGNQLSAPGPVDPYPQTSGWTFWMY
jgi:hypothetical protein